LTHPLLSNVLNTSKPQPPPILDLQDIRKGLQREIAMINEGFGIKRNVARKMCIAASYQSSSFWLSRFRLEVTVDWNIPLTSKSVSKRLSPCIHH
jgi:hypothetical protein